MLSASMSALVDPGEIHRVSIEEGATVAPVALELAPLNPDELFAAAFAERQV